MQWQRGQGRRRTLRKRLAAQVRGCCLHLIWVVLHGALLPAEGHVAVLGGPCGMRWAALLGCCGVASSSCLLP